MSKENEVLARNVFEAPPHINGGESFLIITEIERVEEDEVLMHQKFTLCSYGNEATLLINNGILTPEVLRELADELEETIKTAKQKAAS